MKRIIRPDGRRIKGKTGIQILNQTLDIGRISGDRLLPRTTGAQVIVKLSSEHQGFAIEYISFPNLAMVSAMG